MLTIAFNMAATAVSADAGSDNAGGTCDSEERDKIAEALANPLSYLWLMFTQNDTKWYDGDFLDRLNEDIKVQNITLIQPVMSIQFTRLPVPKATAPALDPTCGEGAG